MTHYFYNNYNILIFYDYRYYCDFNILCIRTPCVIIRTPYIPLDKLYIIDESIRQTKITLFIINFMNNLF